MEWSVKLALILTRFPQNQKLHVENRLLLEKTSDLICENEELRQRLGLDTLEEKEQVKRLSIKLGLSFYW